MWTSLKIEKNVFLGLPNWMYFSEYKNTRWFFIIDKWIRTLFFKNSNIDKIFLSMFGLLYWVKIHFCIEIQNINIGLFKEFNFLIKKKGFYVTVVVFAKILRLLRFFRFISFAKRLSLRVKSGNVIILGDAHSLLAK